jgi:hypothetical protein
MACSSQIRFFKNKNIILLLGILLLIGLSEAGTQDIKKLEDYNILLPVSSNQRFHATHTQKAYNGCFSWHTQDSQLIKL